MDIYTLVAFAVGMPLAFWLIRRIRQIYTKDLFNALVRRRLAFWTTGYSNPTHLFGKSVGIKFVIGAFPKDYPYTFAPEVIYYFWQRDKKASTSYKKYLSFEELLLTRLVHLVFTNDQSWSIGNYIRLGPVADPQDGTIYYLIELRPKSSSELLHYGFPFISGTDIKMFKQYKELSTGRDHYLDRMSPPMAEVFTPDVRTMFQLVREGFYPWVLYMVGVFLNASKILKSIWKKG